MENKTAKIFSNFHGVLRFQKHPVKKGHSGLEIERRGPGKPRGHDAARIRQPALDFDFEHLLLHLLLFFRLQQEATLIRFKLVQERGFRPLLIGGRSLQGSQPQLGLPGFGTTNLLRGAAYSLRLGILGIDFDRFCRFLTGFWLISPILTDFCRF